MCPEDTARASDPLLPFPSEVQSEECAGGEGGSHPGGRSGLDKRADVSSIQGGLYQPVLNRILIKNICACQ